MRADAAIAYAAKIKTKNTEAKDISAALLVIPLALCFFSLLLVFEFPAFAEAMSAAGLE